MSMCRPISGSFSTTFNHSPEISPFEHYIRNCSEILRVALNLCVHILYRVSSTFQVPRNNKIHLVRLEVLYYRFLLQKYYVQVYMHIEGEKKEKIKKRRSLHYDYVIM